MKIFNLCFLLCFLMSTLSFAQPASMSYWEVNTADHINESATDQRDKPLLDLETRELSQKILALDIAKNYIPEANDPGWEPIGINSDESFHFDQHSEVHKCNKQVDFTFFQTTLNVDDLSAINDFTVKYEGADDGTRVYIFNNNEWKTDKRADRILNDCQGSSLNCHFNGLEEQLSANSLDQDLKYLLSQGKNRIVVVHFDHCPPGHSLRNIHFKINGEEIIPNSSLYFDGVNDYVLLGEDVSFYHGDSWTIEGWIDPDPGANTILAVVDGNNNVALKINVQNNGHLRFLTRRPASKVGGQVVIEDRVNLIGGGWHHFSVSQHKVASGEYRLTIIVDGKHTTSVSAPNSKGVKFEDGYKFYLGRGTDEALRRFIGKMDEIRIWDHEITFWVNHANMKKRLSTPQYGLIAYYDFNDGEPGEDNRHTLRILPNHQTKGKYTGYLKGFDLKKGVKSNYAEGAPLNN